MFNETDLQFYVIGLLLTILAWIGRTMIAKMDLISKMVTDIDKFIAVLSVKMDKTEDEIKNIERRLDDHETKINELKLNNHKG